jgi:biofilm PGA synthesis protein PgaD
VGQPRPGDPIIRRPLIIDGADTRSVWLRRRDWILSVAMWLVYLYLIREAFEDLYVLTDEAFGWTFSHAARPELPGMFRLLSTFGLYAVVVVVNGVLLIGWALYNQYRFGGRDSRKMIAAVSVADLGSRYGFPGDEVAQWQQARTLVIAHDGEGKLLTVMSLPAAAADRDHGGNPTGL